MEMEEIENYNDSPAVELTALNSKLGALNSYFTE